MAMWIDYGMFGFFIKYGYNHEEEEKLLPGQFKRWQERESLAEDRRQDQGHRHKMLEMIEWL